MALQATIFGIDVTADLIGYPEKKITSSDVEGNVIEPNSKVELINQDGKYSPDNTKNALTGYNGTGAVAEILDGDETILKGTVSRLKESRTRGRVEIFIQSELAQVFSQPVSYVATGVTPSEILEGIITKYLGSEFIHEQSFGRSTQVYNGLNISCNALWYRQDNVKLSTAVNEIAELGVASVFVDPRGRVHFEVFEGRENNGDENEIDSSTVFGEPRQLSGAMNRIYNDYSLGYVSDFGVTAIDSDGLGYGAKTQGLFNTRVWSRDYGNASPLQITGKNAAHQLGGLRMLRDRYPRRLFEVSVLRDSLPIEVGGVYGFTSNDFSGRIFRVKKMTLTEKLQKVILEDILG